MSPVRALNFHGIGRPGGDPLSAGCRTLEPGEAPYWIAPGLFEALVPALAEWSRTRTIPV